MRRYPAAGVAALALLLTSLPGNGAEQFQTFAPFMLHSDGAGELASSRYEFTVETSGRLEVRYEAPREHCASLRLHLFVDNHKAADTAPIAPGQQTNYVNLGPVSAGSHRVSLQAEGIQGGCNAGRVTAWGGVVAVWSSVPDSANNPQALDLGDVVFEVESINFAWGYQQSGRYITANGDIFSFHIPVQRLNLLPGASDDGLYPAEALAARFESQRQALGTAPRPALEHAKLLARELVKLPHGDTPLRAAANDAGETTYVVYVANEAKDRYRRIVLTERGDYEWDHPAPQAIELRRWLEQTGTRQ
jgi:hypothetical protein